MSLHFSANLSMLFTNMPLPQRFLSAREAGFEAVEIQFPYELPADTLLGAMRAARIDTVLINVPAGDLMQGGAGLACVPGRETAFRQAVSQALQYAQTLDVKCVNVLAGRLDAGIGKEQALDVLESNLRHAVPRFSDIGVKTCIEAINHFDMPGFLLNTADDMGNMMARVAHPDLAMQLDLYHMARMDEDLPALLRSGISQIGHIQFADVPGRGAPGTGKLDIAGLFALIDALPYRGFCGAEYKPGADTLESLDWLRRGMQPR